MKTNNSKIKGNWLYFAVKRVFDIIMSFIAIIILAIPMLVIAIIIKCTSKGPIIFKDSRVGKNKKIIHVLKFRTMYEDAETNIDKYLSPEQKQIWDKERKLNDDPRITKVGKFFRKTSLDELPQLFNIFIGQMSFVGTRPITIHELEDNFTQEEQKIITSGKPGLTGYWQIYGRGSAEYDDGERQKLELAYYYKRSVFFDLKMIILTVPAVFKAKGV
ncbi:MAG TPA: exopolysaccharide biosynthesis protein [Firmicutes bacterium]|nr:exopolysaccharide biosynthesis protein [Bacillota bacterium]